MRHGQVDHRRGTGEARCRAPEVGGRHDGPYGPALVVAVPRPPVDGRATEAARRAARRRRRPAPAGRCPLRAGAASRDKLFAVELPADLADAVLLARLRRLRDGSPP